ncbi:MAG: CBS domain-containing protein [Hyphomicrobiales bacterium]
MTRELIAVTEDTPLSEIVALLNRHRIKRVPVMQAGKIVGIVSRGDLLHALAWVFGAQESQEIADADIKSRIMAELESIHATSPRLVDISVRNAEVELQGTLANKGLRDAVLQTVGSVSGIKAIHDHLGWSEPDLSLERHSKAPSRAQTG